MGHRLGRLSSPGPSLRSSSRFLQAIAYVETARFHTRHSIRTDSHMTVHAVPMGQVVLVPRSRPKLDLLDPQRPRLVRLVSIPRLDDCLSLLAAGESSTASS